MKFTEKPVVDPIIAKSNRIDRICNAICGAALATTIAVSGSVIGRAYFGGERSANPGIDVVTPDWPDIPGPPTIPEEPDDGIETYDERPAYINFRDRGIEPSNDAVHVPTHLDRYVDVGGFRVTVDTAAVREGLGPKEFTVVSLNYPDEKGGESIDYSGWGESNTVVVTNGTISDLQASAKSEEQIDKLKEIEADLPMDELLADDEEHASTGDVDIELELLRIPKQGYQLSLETFRFEDDGSVTESDRKDGLLSHVPNANCDSPAAPEDIVAEVELTPKQKKAVCDTLRRYGRLLPNDYRVVLDSVDHNTEAGDSMWGVGELVQLTYPYAGDRNVGLKEGLMPTALHEYMHAGWYQLDEKHPVRVEADEVHYALSLELDELIQNSPESPKDTSRVWGTLTEGTYLPKEPRFGHPWDNATEMMSSTAAVMAYFPDQFLARYKKLKPEEQGMVRQAVNVTNALIKLYYPDVSKVVPKAEQIEKALKLG